MAALERFCLRWNDFESNLSKSFRELRDEADFFDLTLSVGDQQIQAHKLVLSACSPFFRAVLRQNPHAHPLLYLKGVTYADLQAVLSFMYHGEVSVAQDSLNSFLAVAEELRVKGLTQNNSNKSGGGGNSNVNNGGGAASDVDWGDEIKSRGGQRGSTLGGGGGGGVGGGATASKKLDSLSGKANSCIRPAPLDTGTLLSAAAPPSKKLKTSGGGSSAVEASLSVPNTRGRLNEVAQEEEEDDIQEVVPVKQEPGGPVPQDTLGQQQHRGFDTKAHHSNAGTVAELDSNYVEEDYDYSGYEGDEFDSSMMGGAVDQSKDVVESYSTKIEGGKYS